MTTRSVLVRDLAHRMLDTGTDPIVEHILLERVMGFPQTDPRLQSARIRRDRSKWVLELENEQRSDGSWGRFHTSDATRKAKIGSTESGIGRARTLGLGAEHPAVDRAIRYVEGVVHGKTAVPDRAEKNDGWDFAVQLFASGVLAGIAPSHPCLDGPFAVWSEILAHAFATGTYDRQRELAAYRSLTGNRDDVGYLTVRTQYAARVLGSRPLPEGLSRAYVGWLWDEGIQYYEDRLFEMPPRPKKGCFSAHSLLSRFVGWAELASETIEWFWTQRNANGLWDFGPRSDWYRHVPLSEDWRRAGKREQDWSTHVLCLLDAFERA